MYKTVSPWSSDKIIFKLQSVLLSTFLEMFIYVLDCEQIINISANTSLPDF